MANESKLYRIYSFCLTLGICHLLLGTLLLSVFLFRNQPLGNLVSKWKLSFLEANAATVTVTAQVGPIIIVEPACNDTIDNDGDGLIDYPNDPGCSSSSDTDEYNAPSPGGGGGGAPPPTIVTSVVFIGRAYPKSAVTLLKDAQIAATTIAGSDANFQITISGLAGGNYIFSLYSEDREGLRSSLLTFPVSVTAGATTKVSGIFIAPTIAVDKNEVKRGDNIAIFGQSAPVAEITISVNSEEEFFVKKMSDASGAYLLNFDTSVLEMGQHNTKSKAALDGAISSFSKVIGFAVGTKTVFAQPSKCPAKADLNNDCRVNLVDFSIAAYWYKRPLSAAFKAVEREKLNGDGKIDLVDFSIMAFYWTG